MQDYAEWLQKRLPKGKVIPSGVGGASVYLPEYSFFKYLPTNRVAALSDLEKVSNVRIELPNEVILRQLVSAVSRIAWFVPDFVEGNNIDVVESTVYLDGANLYRTFDLFKSKNSAFSFSAIHLDHVFGSYRVISCQFSMHCYNSSNLVACFEMDNCRNCTYSMFCHNCENVHDSIFCFNTKTKRYAIGNLEVGKEKYLLSKKMFVARIISELKQHKTLTADIFNIMG